jgi:N-acetylneuraminate lyase
MFVEKISGLIAAPFAPMDESGSLNYDQIPAYASMLQRNGIRGVFVNGTNGEGLEMHMDERMKMAESWVRYRRDNFSIIIHVGHSDLEASCALASHAQNIGADSIGIMMPVNSSNMTLPELCNRLLVTASVVKDFPVYYYHMPPRTKLNFSVYEILKSIGNKIDNLAGVKFTDYNIMDFTLCKHLDNERFDMIYGRDEMLVNALSFGAKAGIGSTYNFLAPLYFAIMNAFNAGNIQRAVDLQYESMKIINAFAGMDNVHPVAAQKAIMKLVGINCGPIRNVDLRLTQKQIDLLYERLAESGFHTYASKV